MKIEDFTRAKKILAPVDLRDPKRKIKGFLYPNLDVSSINSFIDTKKKSKWDVGMIVFVGIDITKNDLLAKIIDSGKKIESVAKMLES